MAGGHLSNGENMAGIVIPCRDHLIDAENYDQAQTAARDCPACIVLGGDL